MLTDIIKPTLVALGIMLSLVWLLQSLRFLDLVINKGLGLGVFLHLTLLLVPLLLTVIVPLALFAGCCFAFRRWQDDNELTAVLSAGRHPLTLLYPAMLWGIMASLLGFWIYLVALPQSTTAFKNLQYQLRTQEGQLLLEEGTFNQLGDDLMIYLKKRTSPTTLDMILVHDTRNPEAPVTWYARSGEVVVDAEGYPQLVLHNGLRQEIGPEQINMLEFSKYNLDVRERMGNQVLRPRTPEQEEYLLPELLQKANDPTLPAKQRNELRAEAHKRLLWPLTPLPLVLLAAVWLLRPAQRQTSSLRLLVAACVCAVAYQGVLMILFNLAQNGNIYALWGQWLILPAALMAALMIARKGQRTYGA